jgi:type II secretory pathway component PulC
MSPDVAQRAEDRWGVERDLVEFYATHLRELSRLAAVSRHETDGRPDGFRLGMGRCSVLKQAGFRSGDVVKDVNGRRIHNLFQAVAAYVALRREKEFVVHVVRKGERLALHYRVDRGASRP